MPTLLDFFLIITLQLLRLYFSSAEKLRNHVMQCVAMMLLVDGLLDVLIVSKAVNKK